MSRTRPDPSKLEEARTRPADSYEITIRVRVLDPEAVLKHGRSRYANAPAMNEDGQPVDPEEFLTAVDEALVELYRLCRSESQGVEQIEFEANPNCPWVCHRNGRPISTYRAEWERARALIGRPDLHFHDLRGVAETNMVEWGLPEARARAIIGHRDSKMLARYNRTSDRRTREAGEIIERFHEGLAEAAKKPKPSN